MAEVINTALQSPPANGTHWSVRALARHTGISKSTVHRWFQSFNLQPALDVATGKVLGQCQQRHRHQEFLCFLQQIDRNVPSHLDIHLIVDNYCTHKHAKVKEWLGQRPRFHLHFTPTYASWINQVERFFCIITQQAIRRGSFPSVGPLTLKINDFVEHYNAQARPFVWVATAESIRDKIQRLPKSIYRTIQ